MSNFVNKYFNLDVKVFLWSSEGANNNCNGIYSKFVKIEKRLEIMKNYYCATLGMKDRRTWKKTTT